MPLVSQLQKRTRPVTEADFEGLYGVKLSSGNMLSVRQDVSSWNDCIDIMPQEVRQLFTDYIMQGWTIEFTLGDEGHLVVDAYHTDKSYMSQIYDLQDKEITNVDVSITSQGRSAGSALMLRFCELDVALGCKEKRYNAGKSAGAYAWSRMGAELDKSDSTLPNQSALLRSRLLSLQPLMSRKSFVFANTYAQLVNPEDNCKLASMDEPLILPENYFSKEGDGFGILLQSLNNTSEGNCAIPALDEANRMRKAIDFCRTKNRQITIGRVLLSGLNFDVKFDYARNQQMQRVADYARGFRFSRIAKDQSGCTLQQRNGTRTFSPNFV